MNQVKSKNNSLYVFLITFFLIYGPTLSIEVTFLSDTMLLAIFSGLQYLLILILFRNIKINRNIIYSFIILILVTLYSFIIVWINGFNDNYTFLRAARSLISFWGVIGIGFMYHRNFRKEALSKAFEYVFLAGVVHALIMWGMLVSGGFRDFIHSIVSTNLYDREVLNIVRVSGLMTQGGDGTSLIQGMIAIIFPLVVKDTYGKKKIIYFMLFLVLWTSSFLSARIGFVLSMFWLPIVWLYINYNNTKIKKKIRVDTLILVSLIALILILIPYILPENVLINLTSHYDSPLYRLMEPFRTYTDTGNFSTRSTTRLFGNMIIFPDNFVEMIFGSSNMGRTSILPYIPSDIGYIRLIFGIGVIGSFLLYYFFYFLVKIVKNNNIPDISYKRMFFVIIAYTFMGHFKIVYALSRSSFNITILLLALLMITSDKIINKDIRT